MRPLLAPSLATALKSHVSKILILYIDIIRVLTLYC